MDSLMAPREVAAAFGVSPKTVTKWAQKNLLSSVRTPGGHRRYDRSEVEERLADGATTRTEAE
jgi:excisionase family DNA binding protein